MIVVHAKMQIQASARELFLSEIQTLIAASRAEEGNVSYDLFEDTEQANTFMMMEVWNDKEAIATHNASSHFQAFTGKAPQFMAAPLGIQAYDATTL